MGLSTSEEEYIALTEASKDGIWLKALVIDMGLHHDHVTMYCGSLNAICLPKDHVHHGMTNHIDVRYHIMRSEKKIQVNKVRNTNNLANMFTKPIPQRI